MTIDHNNCINCRQFMLVHARTCIIYIHRWNAFITFKNIQLLQSYSIEHQQRQNNNNKKYWSWIHKMLNELVHECADLLATGVYVHVPWSFTTKIFIIEHIWMGVCKHCRYVDFRSVCYLFIYRCIGNHMIWNVMQRESVYCRQDILWGLHRISLQTSCWFTFHLYDRTKRETNSSKIEERKNFRCLSSSFVSCTAHTHT